MRLSLERLLAELKNAGIQLIELRQLPDEGVDVYTFRAPAPAFPFGQGRKFFWASLSVERGVDTVSRKEVEALLRHLWHAEMEFDYRALAAEKSAAVKR